MSTPGNDGGPAFPGYKNGPIGTIAVQSEGMSLRDYFAGKALGAYLAGRNIGDGRDTFPMGVAQACYRYADAMLKAREDTQ